MDENALQAIKNPAQGLMALNSTQHCLALFDQDWTCADQGGASDTFVFPVLPTDSIKALQDKLQGSAIYDGDKKYLMVFDGKRWQSTKARGRPRFSKESYPLIGIVNAKGEVLADSGFSVEKLGRGAYHMLIQGLNNRQLQSATANVITLGGQKPSG